MSKPPTEYSDTIPLDQTIDWQNIIVLLRRSGPYGYPGSTSVDEDNQLVDQLQ